MKKQEFEDLKKRYALEKEKMLKATGSKSLEHDYSSFVQYALWAESGGYCGKCHDEILEFYDESILDVKRDDVKSMQKWLKLYLSKKKYSNIAPKDLKDLKTLSSLVDDKIQELLKSGGKTLGQRAHIISLNSTDFRPPFTKLYFNNGSKECQYIKKYYGNTALSQDDKSPFLSSKFLNKHKNNVMLCRACHLKMDTMISSPADNIESVLEMIAFKENVYKKHLFNFVINDQFTAITTMNFIDKKVKSFKGKESIKRTEVTFYAIDELKKYSKDDNNQEYTAIDKINSARFSGATIKKILNPIREYYSNLEKEEYTEKSKIYIEKFILRCFVDKGLLTIQISTKNYNESEIDRNQSKEELKIGLKEFKDDLKTKEPAEIKHKNSDDVTIVPRHEWITNSTKLSDNPFRDQREYVLLEKLLWKTLNDFSISNENQFDAISIAYMARWGTGKTSLIKQLMRDRKKYFRFVEINLWHIANTKNLDDKEDNPFIRSIVKDALTQMSNDPEVVKNYMDAIKKSTDVESKIELTNKALANILSLPTDENKVSIINERNKFIDQFLFSLSNFINILFEKSKKPTVFIFDDIDRISNDNNIIDILDALVAFLNLKNCIFIIPVDESKVINALLKAKTGINPNSYINKYFNYTIKAPFVPNFEKASTMKEILDSFEMGIESEITENLIIEIVEPSYRDIKDFLNIYHNNLFQFHYDGNPFLGMLESSKNKDKIFVLATALQIYFPLYGDFLSKDIGNNIQISNALDDVNLIQKLLSKNIPINKDGTLTLQDGEEPADYSFKVKNHLFWSNLLHLDLMPHETKDVFSFNKHLDYFKDDKDKIKNIFEKIELMQKIYSVFNIQHFESQDLILLWSIVTQAKLKSDYAQKFALISPVHSAFLKKNIEEFENSIEILKEQDFKNYFDDREDLVKHSLIPSTDLKISKDNFIRYFQKIISMDNLKEDKEEENAEVKNG